MKKILGASAAAAVIVITLTIIIGQAYVEHEIQDAVGQTINQYNGTLDSITQVQYGKYYTFVMSDNLDEILVHPNKDLIGTVPTAVTNANIETLMILAKLETSSDGVWIEYDFTNPETDTEQHKRTWLISEHGYVFGGGYYFPSFDYPKEPLVDSWDPGPEFEYEIDEEKMTLNDD